MCNVGAHIISRCSECFGIFLSKEQLLKVAKKEEDIALHILGDIGILGLISGIFGG
jgi:hypothetical protein